MSQSLLLFHSFLLCSTDEERRPEDIMDEEIPVIDFSTLAGGAAEERAQVIHHLETVSHDWGFFMVVSNGVPKRLMDEMLDACEGFFNLSEDEKQVYNVKHVLVDPVRFGTSFNTSMEKIRYRRDCLKVFVRPRVPLPCTASRLQVVNHGVPKSLMEAMLNTCMGFFNMREDEKQEYNEKHVLDPIRHGTSFNTSVDKVRYWRDYLKVFVHPDFHSPAKPSGFREISVEYATRTREMTKELLKAIWESLELKPDDMEEALDLNSCFQILVANLYPPCPQPELALGIPPHSDHGLLTVLLENGVNGLKVEHNGKWVHVKSLPNSFLVNTGDQLEIVSNGKYKSVVHQAEVNASSTRMSLVTLVGPSLDNVVVPAPQLVKHKHQLAYNGMKYRDFLEHQQANPLLVKSLLDLLRLHN